MAINPKIKERAEKIRKEVYGKDVREALASGLEVMSEDVEETKQRQDNVKSQFQAVLDETTGKDVISAPEILAARVSTDGTSHSNLKERLDKEHQEVTTHLAETLQDGVHDIATTQDITYYVDAINGNDMNDGLSSATAFQTIGKAIELIPMIVNHRITLKIADGTYDEAIAIKNKYGEGAIYFEPGTNVVIAGYVDSASSSNAKTSFLLNRVYVNVYFNNNFNINPSGDLGSSMFIAIDVVSSNTYSPIQFNFDANNVTTTGSKTGIVSNNAIVYVYQSNINNANFACLTDRNGRIHVRNTTGTGNEVVLHARRGGVISKEGTVPEGTTAESTLYGGVIR